MTGYETDTSGAQLWRPPANRMAPREEALDQIRANIAAGRNAAFYRELLSRLGEPNETTQEPTR